MGMGRDHWCQLRVSDAPFFLGIEQESSELTRVDVVKYLRKIAFIELKSLGELALDLANTFKELMEDGARFFEMTLATQLVLDRS